MTDLEHHLRTLRARAAGLAKASADWGPVDLSAAWQELHQQQRAQVNQLWDTALAGGGIILHLAVLRLLESLPRLQTIAFQARSELRRHVGEGKLPYDVWPTGPRFGLDLLVVQLFDDCCSLWLRSERRCNWFGREPKVAAAYARFMGELADHLAEASPGDGRPQIGGQLPPKAR